VHIPDGLINDPRVWLGADVLAAATVGYAARQESRMLRPEEVPLMGVMAAFVFAGQMLNVPVGPLVSGHLLGALLAAALLGPWRATIVMAVVIAIQCLLHADGGWTALGVNVINMGLAGTLGGWAVYQGIRALVPGRTGVLIGGAVGAWLSVMLGALLVAAELMLTGHPDIVTPARALAIAHAPIGLLEAAITVGALGVVLRARPDLLGLAPGGTPAAETARPAEV